MAKGKGTYSLISVDIAPDEEVVRVDAQGVHREQAGAASVGAGEQAASVVDSGASDGAERAAEGAAVSAKHAAASSSQETAGSAVGKNPADESDSYDGRDDLDGPVPMAGVQRAIIVVVVLCLVAFAVYFAVSHG